MTKPYDELPDSVKPHVTVDPNTKEMMLWDEAAAYVVCRSHYPAIIVAAVKAYSETYLDPDE